MGFIGRAHKAAESCRRADVLAMTKAHVGTAHDFSGRLDEAEADLRETVGMLDKVGDWFGVFSHHILRHIYAVGGDIPREPAEAEAEIAIAMARGHMETLAWGHYGKADALARAGRIREAQDFSARAVESTNSRNAITLAVAYGVLGKTKAAARYLKRATAAAETLGARNDLARALLDASRVLPDRAAAYRRRGQQLLDELGAVVPEAERLPV